MFPYRASSIRRINALLVIVIVLFATAAAYTSYTVLEQLEPRFIGVAAEVNESAGRADDNRELLRLHWQFSALAAGLGVSALLLVALLAWSNRLLRGARRQLQRALQDLRERKEAVKAQNARFEAALSNMSQAICMIDADRRLIVANRRFFELFAIRSLYLDHGSKLETVLAQVEEAKRPRLGIAALYAGDGSPADKPRTVELSDGSVLQVVESRMADGGRVLTYEDVTDRVRAQQHIEYLARHDCLTGLANGVILNEFLERSLYRVHRRGEHFAVLCLDLDRFKGINDSLGRRTGDCLLQAVAERLRAATRDEDLVVRHGGDEFIVVQTGARSAQEAAQLAQRIIAALSRPYTIEGRSIVIGASIGIALAPQNGADAEQLFQNADLALYRAKANGRGSYVFFDDSLHAKVQARRDIELELRRANFDDEFEVLYQQQFDVRSRQLVGVEALLR
jgi:diguanylate cyclase (GGDEF)-like protein